MGQRRRLLIAAGGLLFSTVSGAQRAERMRRIGFLSLDTANSDAGRGVREEFPPALEKFGWRQGINLEIHWRWADGKVAVLDALAVDLVRNSMDLIVARTNAPIRAAMKATTSIPVVMFNGNYPVEAGLVDSMARPGGNVTGTAYVVPETQAKLLQLLKEVAPHVQRVAIPWAWASRPREGELLRGTLQDAAVRLGVTLQYIDVSSPDQITEVIHSIAKSRVEGLLFFGDPTSRSRTADFIAISRARKIAMVASIPGVADAGGLIAYAPVQEEFTEQTARYVDRILKGARPADLPVHQPTRYRLVVNLQTAKAIGIKVPQSMLARADSAIE